MAFDAAIPVAGIDIGGDKKGCHLVVLQGREILCSIEGNPEYVARQCIESGAVAVGIDAPCRWGVPGIGREAEKALARERIFSFATPTRERAAANASGFYGWMFNGERVYLALAATYPLLAEKCYASRRVCFETFPHAVACAMLGSDVASAKRKRTQRRRLLEDSGIDTRCLKSIDALDAALCALTASYLILGRTKPYGEAESGFIFVPDIGGRANQGFMPYPCTGTALQE